MLEEVLQDKVPVAAPHTGPHVHGPAKQTSWGTSDDQV